MGLDMYLHKKTYVKHWQSPKNKEQNSITIRGKAAEEIDPNKISTIEEEVMYWRKDNQIHAWFVDNVQGGVDDCKEYLVTREELEKLQSIIGEVLNDPKKAPDLLPTREGFFFGSYDYDDDYFEGLKETQKALTEILAKPISFGADYYYSSSW